MSDLRRRRERAGVLDARHLREQTRQRVRIAAGAIGLLLLLTACGAPAPPTQPTPKVSIAAALARDVTDWDEFTGRFEAVESVEIRPRVNGYVERVAFEQGRQVNKGELLFLIDPRPYAAEVRRTAAEVARARAAADLVNDQLKRAQKLIAVGAVSRDELDQRSHAAQQAAAVVEAAAAALDSARLNLGFTRIAAPIAGRAGKALVTQGNLVQAGQNATLLTTLVSMDPIYVEFAGDEGIYLKYTEMSQRGVRPSSRDVANPVFLGLANEVGYPHEGRMTFVDNQLDAQTGTIRARASFPNKQGLFTPGLFARLKLLGSGKYHAVLINDQAVGTDQDQKFALVMGAGNKLAYRPIKIGRLVDGLRVVQSGLKEGELIVVNGLQRVHPGMVVAPERVAMDAGIPSSARDPATSAAPKSSTAAQR